MSITLTLLIPVATALLLLCIPKDKTAELRITALFGSLATLAFSLTLLGGFAAQYGAGFQFTEKHEGVPSLLVHYHVGIDGISLPLILLTSFISLWAMVASWSITKQIKGYLILFLLLETGMLGVFMATDFFLFYVFWEVMLLPMYFLIGIWGGPRKEYAAIKFFLYTLFGSVLMLVALLMIYFNSQHPDSKEHIFDLLLLTDAAQGNEGLLNPVMQQWAFWLLFIGFAIKIPSVPFHTWLPDAHVEAPTPISMILAGVLLKMGGYGILRIAFPLCPVAVFDGSTVLVAIGVISIIYGAFAAMAQTDFKRLVAYSSVSHMGYVVLGIGVVGVVSADTASDYWNCLLYTSDAADE